MAKAEKSTTGANYSTSEYWAIDRLKLWDRNPRSIKGDRFEELKARLKRQGQIKPLLVTKDGTVIGGNMRLRAMKDLGWTEVWVSITEATSDKEIFDLALTDNEEFGYYEKEQLAELALSVGLSELELDAYEVNLGDPGTLRGLIDELSPEPEVVEDEAPEVDETEPPKSRLGEVYQLGPHRLMCGSATEDDDVATLLDGSSIDLVFTDPPYGVSYKSKKLGSIQNDDLAGDDLYQFIRDSFSLILPSLSQGAAVYCWYEDKFRHLFQKAIEDAGYEFKQNLVWNKGMNLSGADYQKAHENCLYMQVVGDKARWYGGRDKKTILGLRRRDVLAMKKSELAGMIIAMQNEQTVWDFDRDSVTTYVHPTQKPVKLAATAIRNSTKADQAVVDLFGGSGSTLMAAHQTGRRSFTMEYDPKFCDVIRKRYWIFINGDEEGWEAGTPAITKQEAQAA